MRRWIAESAVTTIVFTVLQGVAGALMLGGEPVLPGAFAWGLASNALTALLLFLVLFGIPANYLAEAFFFDIGLPRPALLRVYGFQFVVAAALAAFVSWRAGTPVSPIRRGPRSALDWAWRLALGCAAYVVAYFTAGLAAFPSWRTSTPAGRCRASEPSP